MFVGSAIASAGASALVGGLLGGGSSGGGQQTSTATKDPWGPAQDWLKANLTSGRNLQDQYMQNPFSGYQANAYGNSQQLSQAARSMLGNLIPQMNGHTGFDRMNPLGRSAPYQFGSAAPAQTPLDGGLNLGMGGNGVSVNPGAAVAAAAPAPQASSGNDQKTIDELLRRIGNNSGFVDGTGRGD